MLVQMIEQIYTARIKILYYTVYSLETMNTSSSRLWAFRPSAIADQQVGIKIEERKQGVHLNGFLLSF